MAMDSMGETFYEYELSARDIQNRETRKAALREALENMQAPLEEVRAAREAGNLDKAMKPVGEVKRILGEAGINDHNPHQDAEEKELIQKHVDIAFELLEITAEQLVKATNELIGKWGEDFIRESLHKVHLNLRLAVFLSDYYIACLEKNEEWFQKIAEDVYYDDPWFEKKRNSIFHSQIFCGVQIDSWKSGIAEKYSLMRIYLAAATYPMLEANYTRLAQKDFDYIPEEQLSIREQVRRRYANSHYEDQKHFFNHKHSGLAKLPPLTRSELILAEQLFDKNKWAKDTLRETGSLPEELRKDPEVVCARPKPTLIFDEFRECFLEKYNELLIGSQEEEKPGLGILGYITTPEPTDEELAEGVKKMRENAVTLLENFREEHFIRDRKTGRYSLREEYGNQYENQYGQTIDVFTTQKDFSFASNVDLFQFLAGRLEADHYDGYKQLNEAGATEEDVETLLYLGKTIYQEDITSRMWIEIGAMFGWAIVVCGFFTRGRGLTFKGACELPVGLFANVYFFIVDTRNYREALRYAFYRPDGSRPSYQDMSELESLAFAAAASTLMVPFFTGIPQLARGLRNGDDIAKKVTFKLGDDIAKNFKIQSSQIADEHMPWASVLVRKFKRFWNSFTEGIKGNPYAVSSLEKLASLEGKSTPPPTNLEQNLSPYRLEQNLPHPNPQQILLLPDSRNLPSSTNSTF